MANINWPYATPSTGSFLAYTPTGRGCSLLFLRRELGATKENIFVADHELCQTPDVGDREEAS